MKRHKASVHVYIDRAVLDKARDFVYWKPGYTLEDLIEELLAREIELYEQEYGEVEKREDSGLNAPRK